MKQRKPTITVITPRHACVVTHQGMDTATLTVSEHDVYGGNIIQTRSTRESRLKSTRHWKVVEVLGQVEVGKDSIVEVFLIQELFEVPRTVDLIVERHYIEGRGWRGYNWLGWPEHRN